jgi:oxygen-independent coproporphyrinogen-3 oxidase
VARLLHALRSRVTPSAGAEITIEANPDDISPESIRAWRDAGVNRLSIGSQSFDDHVLTWMHRTHHSAQIEFAVELARANGIDNLSLDLIFALPQELGRVWQQDIERTLELAPQHLSLYGLTVEPATPLGRWRDRGLVRETPETNYEEEFLLAHDLLTAAGFEHYEVSNFARRGARSRHNSSYWAGAPYAGLGPSAHEYDGRQRRWNASSYVEWVRRLAQRDDPVAGVEELSAANRADEAVYLGLRTTNGFQVSDVEQEHLRPWLEAGWAAVDGEVLRLTPLGWLRLDALAADLTLFRSR